MTTQRPADERVVPADIYKRASTREFLDAVAAYVPELDRMTEDRKLAVAYALAWQESQSPQAGARARAAGAAFGFDPGALADLQALAYVHVLPSLTSDVELLPRRSRLGARVRNLFTRRK